MKTSTDSNDLTAEHDDFGGLARDLDQMIGRRRALQWVGGVSLAGLVAACGSDSTETDASPTSSASDSTTEATTSAADNTADATAGAEIPDETAGPFPADGSNGPNVLDVDGVVRRDLTASIGDLSGVADGVPTTIELTVVDAATGAAIPGAAVYLWHCTADGSYSIYQIEDQNYLRGVQAADDAGRLSFDTIFPGTYRGRWPHCHFEVYPSLAEATAGNQAIKTSQLAVPQADSEVVYADSRYGNSASNLADLSLTTDNVFSDGWEDQLATVSGSVDAGYTMSLLVRV